MAASFFFYDLETTGVRPRSARVMQFAGQRTDQNLKPIGDPYNILISLTEDILPDPDAILLTGITPQQTIQEGIGEAEFCKIFINEIMQPDTCFLGYNNIRFDDEFMRFLLYRNFYDPYAWQWKNGSSRWDLLDIVRMTRALRPGNIKWPVDDKGVCTNRLELIAKENKLLHESAHDALSDVVATIAIAELIKKEQPKLFDYFYEMRGKREVTAFISKGQPFVYCSGRYASEFDKTTVVCNLGPHPGKQGVLVYDLRNDPTLFLDMDVVQLADAWKYNPDRDAPRFPIKAMQLNRAPAIAPLNVIDSETAKRLQIDMSVIKKHKAILDADSGFYERLRSAVDVMNKLRGDQSVLFGDLQCPDEQLYDKFIPDVDRKAADKLVKARPDQISEIGAHFSDERLKAILPLYKARNLPDYLTEDELTVWEEHRKHVLLGGGPDSNLARFSKRLNELNNQMTDKNKQYLLEELRLYAESIVPEF